ncbi:DUF4149 domain-containing protein [Comamonas flocculans]|uniref:DUF4149 domain-containing protein n=1 Tax=Comamonas flocculans TaxID=2597701 RepID=A0A5B8RSE3_9BURK|nr:DUF4149 domain-containing protein [Comamonas flocculans]QEA11758.1 DUF4149 domain-containing protein [Comamonas flocculans]
MFQRLPVFAAALWWSSLSVIGFVAVPLVFMRVPQKMLAGYVTAGLFEAQTWISVACCALLLVVSRPKHSETVAPWARAALIFVILGMLLALLLQFGVAPKVIAYHGVRLWHNAATVMYFGQWLCASVVLWRLAGPAGAKADAVSDR